MLNAGVTRRDFLRTSGVMATAAATGNLLSGCGVSHAQSSALWDNHSNTELTVELPSGALVKGYVASAFRPVFDTFVANFAERGEIGASLAITIKGTPVLEAWGGFSDTLAAKPSKPWTRDTVSLIFSCTKGATALCAHLLAARGQLDLDAPVSRYWPEFAANGKDKATVRMLLDHSVGVPALRDPVPAKGWADWSTMATRLAAEAPWWEPGTAHGYHVVTYGWLVGEVVRRVSGISVGSFFAREIAAPLGLDFHIGAPASIEPRVSPMLPSSELVPTDQFTVKAYTDPATLQAKTLNIGDWLDPSVMNSAEGHKAEIPGANGITNAQSLAAMYAVLANGGTNQGVQLLPPEYTEQIGLVRSASHIDRVLLASTRFGLGYVNSFDNRKTGPNMSFLIGPHAFGHPGAGGSFGLADPQASLSVGYTMNRMGAGINLNDRGQSLVDATYRVLGRNSNKYGFWI